MIIVDTRQKDTQHDAADLPDRYRIDHRPATATMDHFWPFPAVAPRYERRTPALIALTARLKHCVGRRRRHIGTWREAASRSVTERQKEHQERDTF